MNPSLKSTAVTEGYKRERKKKWWGYQLLSSWTPLDSAETSSTRWFAFLQTRIHTPVQTHLRAVQELLEDQRRLRSADCRRLSSTLNDLDWTCVWRARKSSSPVITRSFLEHGQIILVWHRLSDLTKTWGVMLKTPPPKQPFFNVYLHWNF